MRNLRHIIFHVKAIISTVFEIFSSAPIVNNNNEKSMLFSEFQRENTLLNEIKEIHFNMNQVIMPT